MDVLIARLRDRSSEVRKSASWALGDLGEKKAVEPLLACLHHQDAADARVRRVEPGATRRYTGGCITARLIAQPGILVRSYAAESLGQLGDRRAVALLIACLRGEAWVVRSAAAKGLGQLGDGRAVEPLIVCLEDERVWVRAEAAASLGQMGDARAIEPLRMLARSSWGDQQGWAKEKVRAALQQLTGE